MSQYENEIDNVSAISRKVWVWVVAQAVMEATGRGMNGVPVEDQAIFRTRAIEWLTTESDDLREVCEFAGLGYRSVVEKSRKKFLKGGK